MTQQYRMEELEVAQIIPDKELQVRYETNEDVARDYYEAMETEEDVKKFPPMTVYFDGCRHWLADGHHRYWAVHRRGYQKILVRVIDGSRNDAILAAVKLNSKNGLRFNDDDWEKIVPLIASKDQWSDWSNRRLADELGCSYETVRRHRPGAGDTGVSPEKRMGKDGKLYPTTVSKKPKATSIEPSSGTATMSSEPPVVESTTSTPDVAKQSATDNAFAEAKAGEERIFDLVATLEQQINEWIDSAPPELHAEFDNRLRKRIAEMIN